MTPASSPPTSAIQTHSALDAFPGAGASARARAMRARGRPRSGRTCRWRSRTAGGQRRRASSSRARRTSGNGGHAWRRPSSRASAPSRARAAPSPTPAERSRGRSGAGPSGAAAACRSARETLLAGARRAPSRRARGMTRGTLPRPAIRTTVSASSRSSPGRRRGCSARPPRRARRRAARPRARPGEWTSADPARRQHRHPNGCPRSAARSASPRSRRLAARAGPVDGGGVDEHDSVSPLRGREGQLLGALLRALVGGSLRVGGQPRLVERLARPGVEDVDRARVDHPADPGAHGRADEAAVPSAFTRSNSRSSRNHCSGSPIALKTSSHPSTAAGSSTGGSRRPPPAPRPRAPRSRARPGRAPARAPRRRARAEPARPRDPPSRWPL